MNAFGWAILTACIWGVVPLLEKLGLAKTSPLAGIFYRSLGVLVGIVLLVFFIVKPQQIKSVNLRSALMLMLGGFLASFVAQISFYHALKAGQMSKVVPISGSYPLIAFMLGVLLLGESISPVKLIGVLLIVMGIWTLK